MAKGGDFGRTHETGIGMREQTGFLKDQLCAFSQIRKRCPMPESFEFLASQPVALFRLVSQCEKGLTASCLGSGAGNFQNFLVRQKGIFPTPGWVRKGAIMTNIAAQMSERNEYFARIRNDASMVLVTLTCRSGHQGFQVGDIRQAERLVIANLAAVSNLSQKLDRVQFPIYQHHRITLFRPRRLSLLHLSPRLGGCAKVQ